MQSGTFANPSPPANQLLTALPSDVLDRIGPSLDVVPLKLKQFLHNAGEPIRQVYFPGGGFVSMVTMLKDGGMVEVATVGREGMVGSSAILNSESSTSASMVQSETAPAIGCQPTSSARKSAGATRSTT